MIKFIGPEDRIIRFSDRVNNKVNEYRTDKERQLLIYLYQEMDQTGC